MISDKATWRSFSGSLAKVAKERATISSERGKRYFGPSKMSFKNLILHSLSIISVFKIRVIIRSVTPANGLGNTGYTCSYHATGLMPGQPGTAKLIGEQRANSTGTNHETVIFDFTNGVTSGSYDDVPVNERVYMALQSDTSVSSITVLAATALWEWDYNSI